MDEIDGMKMKFNKTGIYHAQDDFECPQNKYLTILNAFIHYSIPLLVTLTNTYV